LTGASESMGNLSGGTERYARRLPTLRCDAKTERLSEVPSEPWLFALAEMVKTRAHHTVAAQVL
jgi:hypothetical protein